MPRLQGVLPPVPTPFAGEDVAPDRLRENLARWNATALAGYVVLGSTGEFPFLTEGERDRVLAAAREAIPPGKAFVAGTGAESTVVTIRQTRRAAALGADAAIVITPHYYKAVVSTAPAQIRHYLEVAEASPLPILLYNFPQNTGIDLAPETVARLAEHPNVSGIKDSSGRIPGIAHMIDLTPDSFSVLVGAPTALLPALAIGAAGGILGLANVAPRDCCELYAHARAGRWEEARSIAVRLVALDRGVQGIGAVKAALDLQGLYGGPVRSPLASPDEQGLERIRETLAALGLLEG